MMYDHDHEQEVNLFAATNFRNEGRRFGIKTDDRRRHMYVIGKTGMGKSTMLENMIAQDIEAGHGVALVDPHGDFAEKMLDFIPAHRVNDVVYFNPADMDHPIGFNVLETIDPAHKHLVSAGLMGVFKKIWPDVWSARMEYILSNAILALLDYPGSTLLGINRLLVEKEFRKRVIAKVTDPVVKSFWVNEYAAWEARFRNEAIAPIQNKVGQFLSASIIRNIVAQVKSTINIRDIMDSGKIFIINLSKGRIGEDNSRLLGGMVITKMQLSAMERVDTPEKDRRDFYLYVDEFQNFATESFANILSEARKYHLNLIMAHQYIEQLEEEVRDAVFGNVGTLVGFRIGAADAEVLATEFAPRFTEEDLVNLAKYDIYLKLMIDGAASSPFSATTLPPLVEVSGNRDKVIRVSRERYSQNKEVIEEKIMRWSGLYPEEEGLAPAEAPAAVAPAPRARPVTWSQGRSEAERGGGAARPPLPQSVAYGPRPYREARRETKDREPVFREAAARPRSPEQTGFKKPTARPGREKTDRPPASGIRTGEPVLKTVADVKPISLSELARKAPAPPAFKEETPHQSPEGEQVPYGAGKLGTGQEGKKNYERGERAEKVKPPASNHEKRQGHEPPKPVRPDSARPAASTQKKIAPGEVVKFDAVGTSETDGVPRSDVSRNGEASGAKAQ